MPKRPGVLSEGSERPPPGSVGPVRRVGRKVASVTLQAADALVLQLTQAVREEVKAQEEMRADCDPVASRNYRRAKRKRQLCENRVLTALLTEYTA